MAPGTVALLIKMIYDAWTNISPMPSCDLQEYVHVKHAYSNPLDEEML